MTVAFPPRPPGRAIEEHIEIDAPAARVWQVLTDVAHWSTWNPVYPEASGSAAQGGHITMTVTLPGSRAQRFTADVLWADTDSALQFGAAAIGGLLYATRYVEIEPLEAARCRVVNGEALSRLLGPLVVRLGGAAIRKGLRLQNAGLKQAAEQA